MSAERGLQGDAGSRHGGGECCVCCVETIAFARYSTGMFPQTRLRRLRSHPVLRDLVRETSLSVHDFILPLFVRSGKNIKNEIASMPGNYQLSVDRLIEEVGAAVDLGIRAFIFFGIPASKDAQ